MIDREQIENWKMNMETHQLFPPDRPVTPKRPSKEKYQTCYRCGAAKQELVEFSCEEYLTEFGEPHP